MLRLRTTQCYTVLHVGAGNRAQDFSAAFLSSSSQQLFSAAFLSSLSQQLFSAALLSSSSQQLFSAAFLSSLSQQLFPAAFLSSLSQQLFSADFLSSSSQQLFSAIILLWSGVGGQLVTSSSAALLSYHLAVVRGWWSASNIIFSSSSQLIFSAIILLWSGVGGQVGYRSLEGPFRNAFRNYTVLHVGAGNRAQDLLLPRLTPYPRGKFSGTTIFKRLW